MSLDVLILGPYVFTDFATPEKMPFGGKQQTIVHKMPGGTRVVDCMGLDDDDRNWAGILWGQQALDDMLELDAMRQSGVELPFSWGAESRTAVILEVKFAVEKFLCIHYDISIVLTDSGSGGFGGAITTLDSLVGADLSAAVGL